MSKVVHRKPVWGWSAILLSTLLLSPMATTAVLYALVQASSSFAQAQAAAGRVAAGATQDVRRADEQETLRAALSEHRIRIRVDSDPDSVALIVPQRSLLLVPDDAPEAPIAAVSTPVVTQPVHSLASRAPPSASLS